MKFVVTVFWGVLLGTSTAVNCMSISPILVDLTTQKKVVSVTLGNTSDKKLIYQATTLSWTQVDGQNQYTETRDLLVVPPIVEIPAGASQIFRVTTRQPQINAVEKSYRLILENVTPEHSFQSEKTNNIVFRINHDIPVFVAPTVNTGHQTRWSTCTAIKGKGCLKIENTGNERVRFSELQINGQNWKKTLTMNETLLAGAWKQWQYDLPVNSSIPLVVKLKTDHGVIEIKE